jgi:signal transduction histidine kinase
MPVSLRDLGALLIALGATCASVIAWSNGSVSLGLQLAEADGHVQVADVTPDGNAAWYGWNPGTRVLDLTTVDGSDVQRGDSLETELEANDYPPGMTWHHPEADFWPGEGTYLTPQHRPPTRAIDESRIESVLFGDVSRDSPEILVFGQLDRSLLELDLRWSIWLLAFGAALGVVVWRVLRRNVAGHVGSEHAVVVGCAVAAPFLVLPLVEVGTTAGIVAGFMVPAAIALILGLSLARLHPDHSWREAASVSALVPTGLAMLLLVRYMTSFGPAPSDRGGVLVMIASIAVIPALIAATGMGQTLRQRLGLVSIGLLPAAALTLTGPRPDALGPTALVGILVGWQALPIEGISLRLRQGATPLHGDVPAVSLRAVAGIASRTRDILAVGLFAAAVLVAILLTSDSSSVIAALGLAGLAWFVVRLGFLGAAWSDAAVPLAVAVGMPLVLTPFESLSSHDGAAWILSATALAGLPVAHVLASRYPQPPTGKRLLLASAVLVPLVWAVATLVADSPGLALAGCVALVPGIPLASSRRADDATGVSARLETMAVALTPAAAATTLVPVGAVVFGGWLAALVIWKYATVTPLLRFAQRTQLQRDLAVAAAETERARLAADLHDDALQHLTRLIRKLDERGDADVAAEAREIADKLRAVVGDLRLPILDVLGAGAALEWLVERVEPLAGGAVTLERSDPTRPPAAVELAVFRVAQEALTNAIKHGRPPITVRYDVDADGRVTLAIDDAGEGIGANAAEEGPRQGHFGLANMQQRAEQIGAALDVRRWSGGGTRVALEWRPR